MIGPKSAIYLNLSSTSHGSEDFPRRSLTYCFHVSLRSIVTPNRRNIASFLEFLDEYTSKLTAMIKIAVPIPKHFWTQHTLHLNFLHAAHQSLMTEMELTETSFLEE